VQVDVVDSGAIFAITEPDFDGIADADADERAGDRAVEGPDAIVGPGCDLADLLRRFEADDDVRGGAILALGDIRRGEEGCVDRVEFIVVTPCGGERGAEDGQGAKGEQDGTAKPHISPHHLNGPALITAGPVRCA